jgi:Bacterial dnaA protein helix-turn-helix
MSGFASAAALRAHYDDITAKFWPNGKTTYAHAKYRPPEPEPEPEPVVVELAPVAIEAGVVIVPPPPPKPKPLPKPAELIRGCHLTKQQQEKIVLELLEYARAMVPRATIRDIQRIVSRAYQVQVQELIGPQRTEYFVYARHCAIYICRMVTLQSLPVIGLRFGGRDHTTMLHACRKYEHLNAVARSPWEYQIVDDGQALQLSA